MPNTNTRWYRLLMQDRGVRKDLIRDYVAMLPNVVTHSYLISTGYMNDETEFQQMILTIIMNGSKASDDASMTSLAQYVESLGHTVHLTVVTSDTVYP